MNYISANSKYEVFVKNIEIKQKFDKLMTKSVNVTPEQVKQCIEFAKESVESSNDYKKLVPNDIKDIELQKEVGMQRIFVEKIAECGFVNYLMSRGVDSSAINKHKIGIKTAIAKEIHTRLVIDKSEFEIKKNKKNYYVGVHLNLEMKDKKDKIQRHIVKDLYEIEKVQIFGYLDYKFLNELKYETVKNKMGKKEFKFYNKKANGYESKDEYAKLLDNECKWYYLDKMMPIDTLSKKIK
ncbi:MAG: hypothetical protein ACRC3Y_04935 [Romboutsia sp.]|uniref:hypothetical protein n=1 Tax=Romboutsia sp. TaxID=1965302 RepID=UPI003F392713